MATDPKSIEYIAEQLAYGHGLPNSLEEAYAVARQYAVDEEEADAIAAFYYEVYGTTRS